AAPARAAAHAEMLVTLHLRHVRPGLPEDLARLVVDLVETSVVAGVVVHRALAEAGRDLETSTREELLHQLGRVHDLVASVELRELVADRVEAVGTVGDDLPHLVAVQRLDQGLRHGLVEVLVAETARGLAVAELLRAEAGEVDTRLPEQAGEGLGGLL